MVERKVAKKRPRVRRYYVVRRPSHPTMQHVWVIAVRVIVERRLLHTWFVELFESLSYGATIHTCRRSLMVTAPCYVCQHIDCLLRAKALFIDVFVA